MAALRDPDLTPRDSTLDLLITGGTVITMDRARRVITDGAVAVRGDRIVAVGAAADLASRPARRRISAARMAVLPGLIDAHAHAGHGLVKTMGGGREDLWYRACEQIYTVGSGEAFWYAEARLSALERLKSGTTCGVSYLGGGDSIMRTDDPRYAGRHLAAVEEVGIRAMLAVGPCRPPFPRRYVHWIDGQPREVSVTFEQQLETCEAIVRDWHGRAAGRLGVWLAFPVHHARLPAHHHEQLELITRQARATRALARRLGVRFTQDGHRKGSITIAHRDMDLLGSDVLLSHCVDMSPEEIELCRATDTRIAHNPSAHAAIMGRCPVPELIDAGVTVALGSDGTAPDRSADMFRHMFQCMHYHRTHHHDPRYLPPGKVLEMVTIDAARALGLEREIGSLEVEKRADLILVDLAKPHLYPLNMPVSRLAYFATGADVDTVIVDGRVLMEGRRVVSVDEAAVLDAAQRESELMLDRTGLRGLLETPPGFWGQSRF